MAESKVFNFGIISTAGIAIKLAHAIEDCPSANLYAISSRSIEKAQEWTKKHNYPNTKTYGSYDEIIDDKNIDIVYIPLPTAHKYDWAIKAAQKGKHIMCEKPLMGTTDTTQLQNLLKVCADNKVQFMDCTMWVHSPRTTKIEEEIKNGNIGKVVQVISSFTMFQDEESRNENIRGKTDLEPLGSLGDMAWYPSMATNVVFGFENPVKLQALNWKHSKNGAIYQFSGVIHYPDSRLSYINGSFCESINDFLIVQGEKGTLRVEGFVGQNDEQKSGWEPYSTRFVGGGSYEKTTQDEKCLNAQNVKVGKSDSVVHLVSDFIDLVKNNDQTQKWGQRSLHNQRFMIHFLKSIETNGAPIQFDKNI